MTEEERKALLYKLIGGRVCVYKGWLTPTVLIYTDTHLLEAGYAWPVPAGCNVYDIPPKGFKRIRHMQWYSAWCDKKARIKLRSRVWVMAYHYKSEVYPRGLWVSERIVDYVEQTRKMVLPALGFCSDIHNTDTLAEGMVGWLTHAPKEKHKRLAVASTALKTFVPMVISPEPFEPSTIKGRRPSLIRDPKRRAAAVHQKVVGFRRSKKVRRRRRKW